MAKCLTHSKKQKVLERDNYRCGNCGRHGGSYSDTKLHVHHVVPKKDGGTDRLGNLRTLCEDCHNAIHHKGKKALTARGRGIQIDREKNKTVQVAQALIQKPKFYHKREKVCKIVGCSETTFYYGRELYDHDADINIPSNEQNQMIQTYF